MEYTLNIETNKGPISVKWSNLDDLALYANLQSGFYLQSNQSFSKDLLLNNFKDWNQMFWNQTNIARKGQGPLWKNMGSKAED
jgi:hypothetical protein